MGVTEGMHSTETVLAVWPHCRRGWVPLPPAENWTEPPELDCHSVANSGKLDVISGFICQKWEQRENPGLVIKMRLKQSIWARNMWQLLRKSRACGLWEVRKSHTARSWAGAVGTKGSLWADAAVTEGQDREEHMGTGAWVWAWVSCDRGHPPIYLGKKSSHVKHFGIVATSVNPALCVLCKCIRKLCRMTLKSPRFGAAFIVPPSHWTPFL